ncbi:ribose-phosphate diphosphokinase [Tundrisphaera lichenicola]|uniref:ribose-phosphate diphosphokinase n=1 Tax=Tundrisphaera lichenicola TaxID=2029860 RepID=UPI003EB89505
MAVDYLLFAGPANPALASGIAAELGIRTSICSFGQYPDGEISVRIDEPVRGRDVFVIQPTGPPVNDHLIQLLTFADACRRASAHRITAVVPYLGYSRSDKRHGQREPITASLVARMIEASGIDQILTFDLHAEQIEGFFRIPVDCLTAVPTLCRALRDQVPSDVLIVSPDTGRVRMATEFAHRLNTSVVVLHKRRSAGRDPEVTHVVGDVRGRCCLIIDDQISTAGTMARAIEALVAAGARPEITIVATHGLFVGDARTKLDHEAIRRILVTDSVAETEPSWATIQRVSIAPLLAAAIRRIQSDGSLGDLFQDAFCSVQSAPVAH